MNTILYIAGSLIFLLATSLLYMGCASQFGARTKGMAFKKMEKSENYRDGKFVNLEKTTMMAEDTSTMGSIYKWLKGGENTIPEKPIQSEKFDKDDFISSKKGIHLTWFGHSTVLLNINGKIILTDPVFSDNPSPLGFGNKAFDFTNKPDINDLPEIDMVLISHDHYDHLDMESIKAIHRRVKKILVPLGVGAHLKLWGVPEDKIIELDWWESYSPMESVEFTAAPARHFSGRTLLDRNKTQWSSWVIKVKKSKIYFSGDSGYGEHFKTIGEKYGPFDLTMMECGQYNEDWPYIHMQPEETIKANKDLKGRVMMPIHWGKFKLALHSWYDPVEGLLNSASGYDVKIVTPVAGSKLSINKDVNTTRWWKKYITKKGKSE